MPATEASVGYGIILKKETATPGTYADYGLEIVNVAAPGVSRSAQDASHMQSPDGYTEMIYGMKTTKPVTVEFNWVAENTAEIVDALEGDPGNWQMLFPDTTTCTFFGAITDLDISGLTPDGKMAASATITPSGKPTWS